MKPFHIGLIVAAAFAIAFPAGYYSAPSLEDQVMDKAHEVIERTDEILDSRIELRNKHTALVAKVSHMAEVEKLTTFTMTPDQRKLFDEVRFLARLCAIDAESANVTPQSCSIAQAATRLIVDRSEMERLQRLLDRTK